MLTFILAAAVSAGSAAGPAGGSEQRGARVQVVATVTILRAETASEAAAPGGLMRHVSRRSDGSAAIVFE